MQLLATTKQKARHSRLSGIAGAHPLLLDFQVFLERDYATYTTSLPHLQQCFFRPELSLRKSNRFCWLMSRSTGLDISIAGKSQQRATELAPPEGLVSEQVGHSDVFPTHGMNAVSANLRTWSPPFRLTGRRKGWARSDSFILRRRPLPDHAALRIGPHHGRTRLALECLGKRREIRHRSEHPILRHRMRVIPPDSPKNNTLIPSMRLTTGTEILPRAPWSRKTRHKEDEWLTPGSFRVKISMRV